VFWCIIYLSINYSTEALVNRNQLVTKVSREIDVPKSIVDRCLVGLVDTIKQNLLDGIDTKIHEFGTFKTSKRIARKGIVPATKESIDIPESTKVRFKASPLLNDLLNEGDSI
jgi:DNA-binding protein HU-beta